MRMELIYLFGSIISTFLTTLLLSLLLPFRLLLRRRNHSHSHFLSLYEGTVWHERRRPVHHSFTYSVRYALFDLDSASASLQNHLSADEARRVAGTTGPVFLLSIPESVGYEQNPLSLYYCYDLEDSAQNLNNCIAEVTNTPWGERVTFVFNPKSDLVAKPLHVSPFMDMFGNWNIKASVPGDNLSVAISVQHPTLGNYFTATLRAKKVSLSSVSDQSLYFWLMPHKVAVWIYWHAVKLWWKNVSFIQHPRYSNPAYREEATLRDQKLRCCCVSGFDDLQHIQAEPNGTNSRARSFTWRNAKWPWS
ncbi:uncharacterized protein LOC133800885 [Humulus lupulus]|uniref:uncharacterized protein LOC133800885 n=1 Tax=Humulus lupulus TaxID=3486 RepID=UPI002B405A35|nr:uncharacterized protein LOC133800885 [Humulus lupulus]